MTNLRTNFLNFVLLILYTTNNSMSFAQAHMPKPQILWAKTTPFGQEQKTLLQFYFHDNRTGDFQTVALIAHPIQPTPSAPGFGNLYMIDDPLTMSPDPGSKLVGRAQGFYGSASMESVSYIMGLTFGFVDGVYNGSTVVILGQNSISNRVRELPVVGGTGLFRMARGYAVAQTFFHNSTAHNAIVGYNVTIIHS